MARGRPASSPTSGLPLLLVIVGCASFALGILTPTSKPQVAASLARLAKTPVRALADGTDLGSGVWVGLNDPSIDQTAMFVSRLAGRAAARAPSASQELARVFKPKSSLLRVARNEAKGY